MLKGLAGKLVLLVVVVIFLFILDLILDFETGDFVMKLTGLVENYKLLQSKYKGSWRKMWLSRPRVRTDGKTCIYFHWILSY